MSYHPTVRAGTGDNPVPILKRPVTTKHGKICGGRYRLLAMAMARLYRCQLSGQLTAKAIGLRYRIGWPTATAIGWFSTQLLAK